MGKGLHGGRQLQHLIEIHVAALTQQGLGHAQSLGRLGGDLTGRLHRLVHQGLMRNDAIDQTPLLGRGGVDRAGREQQFSGAIVADIAGQQPRTAVAGNDAQLHEGHAEAGAVRGDADVAQPGDVAA